MHDRALDEVVPNRGHITTEHHIDTGDHRHADHAPFIRQPESHAEQTRKTVVDRCRIRNEEHEDDRGSGNAQRSRVIAFAEEFRHGRSLEPLRHLARTRTEHPPRQKRTDDRITDTDPKYRHAVLPAELASIADEHNSRKIARAKGKG